MWWYWNIFVGKWDYGDKNKRFHVHGWVFNWKLFLKRKNQLKIFAMIKILSILIENKTFMLELKPETLMSVQVVTTWVIKVIGKVSTKIFHHSSIAFRTYESLTRTSMNN